MLDYYSCCAVEFWLDIPEYPAYQVSNTGKVRSCWINGWTEYNPEWRSNPVWRELLPLKHPRGYRRFRLTDKLGSVRIELVHRLLLRAIQGPCPDGYEVRHLDGNPENNHEYNLAYGTKSQNARDRFVHGTDGLGEKNGQSKLTEPEVIELRRLRDQEHLTYDQLADRFKISDTLVYAIVKRKAWRHVS